MGTSDIIALTALALSIVATILSLSVQLRGVTVTTYNNATELTLEVDRIFVEHPALRPIFYDNKPVDDSEQDPNLVLATCELILDVLECVWDHQKGFRKRSNDREAWSDYILDMLRGSDVLRAFFEERPDWYPSLGRLLSERPLSPAAALTSSGPK